MYSEVHAEGPGRPGKDLDHLLAFDKKWHQVDGQVYYLTFTTLRLCWTCHT
jgi:hypothetical protein